MNFHEMRNQIPLTTPDNSLEILKMQNLHIALLSNILLGLRGGASCPQEYGSTGILRALKSISELLHL